MLNFEYKKDLQAEDKEYITDVNVANLYGIAFKFHFILWVAFFFIVFAIVWANLATLDEVTRASGKVIPSSQIQVVQNLEGGILSEILVKEGDVVEIGQALLRLDDVQFSSALNETRIKYYEMMANMARLTAEVEDVPLSLPDELSKNHPGLVIAVTQLYRSRQRELQAVIHILQDQIRQKEQELLELKVKQRQLGNSYALVKQELEMSEPLVQAGALSDVEILRLQRTTNELGGEVDAIKHSIPRVQFSIKEVKNKIEEQKIRFQTEALQQLNEIKTEFGRLSETLFAQKDRVKRTQVDSPVKGTVKQLKVSTIGGVIQPGMDLVEIVPKEDQLLIEAKVRPADIAFLHPGQKAIVKLSAYDFSIYGGLEAELKHISADTIEDKETDETYYLIRLRTDKTYLVNKGEKLDIIAGMVVDVDILTGKKTVMDYLLKPITKARGRALRER